MEDNASERQQVEEAIERLLSGCPQVSSGDHTVVALAIESGVKRTRLYEQYPDLLTGFKTRAQQTVTPRLAAAVSHELTAARDRIDELSDENVRLRARIRTLCAVIAELSIQRDGENVVAFRH
ncbi:hypothetical protein [Prescottella agglutinans]|uniref:hypothetical protein n=1 Tax=Prescottella agglutinans TaxID=1644129 RepID=UPI003D97BE89